MHKLTVAECLLVANPLMWPVSWPILLLWARMSHHQKLQHERAIITGEPIQGHPLDLHERTGYRAYLAGRMKVHSERLDPASQKRLKARKFPLMDAEGLRWVRNLYSGAAEDVLRMFHEELETSAVMPKEAPPPYAREHSHTSPVATNGVLSTARLRESLSTSLNILLAGVDQRSGDQLYTSKHPVIRRDMFRIRRYVEGLLCAWRLLVLLVDIAPRLRLRALERLQVALEEIETRYPVPEYLRHLAAAPQDSVFAASLDAAAMANVDWVLEYIENENVQLVEKMPWIKVRRID